MEINRANLSPVRRFKADIPGLIGRIHLSGGDCQSSPFEGHANWRVEKAVELPRPSPFGEDQDIVGITNSAPARMPVGQRVVIVFSLV